MNKRLIGTVAVISGLALSGCGTTPKPARVHVEGAEPGDGLPITTRIVADERPVVLAGFIMSPATRDALERRYQNAVGRMNSGYAARYATREFVEPRGLLLLPVVLPVALPIAAMIDNSNAQRRANNAGIYEPMTLDDSERLAALFEAGATNAALTKRVMNLAGAKKSSTTADYPRLVIRVVSARVRDHGNLRFFNILSEVQVQLAPADESASTMHSSGFSFRGSDGPTRRGIDAALDALAESIFVTYFPTDPYSVEYNHWKRVRDSHVPAEVNTYLERYPEGRFAQPARKQLGAANRWVESKARHAQVQAEREAEIAKRATYQNVF